MAFKFWGKSVKGLSQDTNSKPQEIGKNKIVLCDKCHATFKLTEDIRIRNNEIECLKCKQIIKIILPQEESKISDEESCKSQGEKSDEDHEVQSYIYKYYGSKNSDFKRYIWELCREKETLNGVFIAMKGLYISHISALSSDTEIKKDIREKLANKERFVEEFNAENMGGYMIYKPNTILKLYEDIQNFQNLFRRKGIIVDYKKILTTFKEIIEKEKEENRLQEIFDEINEAENRKFTESEIIEKYLIYILKTEKNLSISQVSKLEKISKKELPALLSKFGIPCDKLTDDLLRRFDEVVNKLKQESDHKKLEDESDKLDFFERELTSSYDDFISNDQTDSDKSLDSIDEEYDEELLSEYLDEDTED